MYHFEKSNVNVVLRSAIAAGVCFFFFFMVIVRLWYLQVVKGEHFRALSENNRRKTVFVPPPRGLIFDRNSKPVVKNKPAFNIELVLEDSPEPMETVRQLAELVGEDPERLVSKFRAQKNRRKYEPQIVLKDVGRDVVAKVLAHAYALPGILINTYPARDYLYGDFAAHIVGYIREISRRQLDSPGFDGYRPGDLVGQFGLEMQWERQLQGRRGRQQVIVNARGIRIQTEERSFESEIPGHNITLTIDFDVQSAADKNLEGKRGAVVAVVPQTGEILAMSSAPSFDPNVFTGEISRKRWSELVTGRDKPLSNRAVQGAYPPGSVFKAIMSVAGLAEGVITPGDRTYCPGFLRFGSRNYRCHKLSGHGSVNMKESLVVSCDVYFYTLGQRLGVDRIHDYASRFGLGSGTGLKLVQEHPGLMPSTKWKKQHYRGTEQEKWFPGETLSVAIGQGAVQATPLQMALAISALVNGGKVMQPQLIKEISSSDGRFRDTEFSPTQAKQVDVEPWILKKVQQALIGVVNDQRGTGKRAKLPEEFGIKVGGKTGTSQVVALEHAESDERFHHHAWFVGFAPAENPEIVVATIIENGGHGGVAAAPVVREVMRAYFAKKLGIPLEAEQVDLKKEG